MFNWIYKRIFSDERVKDLVQRAQPYLIETMKDSVQAVLEDEEIASAVVGYGDMLYDRYHKKFFGAVGGVTGGINQQIDKLNPISNLFDNKGRFQAKNLIGMVLSGAFSPIAQQTEANQQNTVNSGVKPSNIPEM